MLEGLVAGERVPRAAFDEIKRRAVREAFKWNITDNGVDRLCDFPLFIERSVWLTLSEWAVRLSAEAELAEAELADRPIIQAALGIPWRLQLAMRRTRTIPSLRYCRFDFHPTVDARAQFRLGIEAVVRSRRLSCRNRRNKEFQESQFALAERAQTAMAVGRTA